MNLNNQLIDPVVEAEGPAAALAYVSGGIIGVIIALPVLIGVFGL